MRSARPSSSRDPTPTRFRSAAASSQTNQKQQAAAAAQRAKAGVRLAYSELHAPLDGIVDVIAARLGEVVTPGQPVVTLINPDDLWVRANVEETLHRSRPRRRQAAASGCHRATCERARCSIAASKPSFATQRDVSRTKRDIKTFEIRLRVDNRDRRLAVGHDGLRGPCQCS
mgnify:CR=1 FL=1